MKNNDKGNISQPSKVVRDAGLTSSGLIKDSRHNHALEKLARDAARMEKTFRALESSDKFTAQLQAIERMEIEQAKLATFGAIMPSIDPSVMKVLQGIQPLKIDAGLALVAQEAQKSMEEAMRPLGGIGSAIKLFEEKQRTVQESLAISLAGSIGDVARIGQWASAIGKIRTPDTAGILGGELVAAFDSMREKIALAFTGPIAADSKKLSSLLGLNKGWEGAFESTLVCPHRVDRLVC